MLLHKLAQTGNLGVRFRYGFCLPNQHDGSIVCRKVKGRFRRDQPIQMRHADADLRADDRFHGPTGSRSMPVYEVTLSPVYHRRHDRLTVMDILDMGQLTAIQNDVHSRTVIMTELVRPAQTDFIVRLCKFSHFWLS